MKINFEDDYIDNALFPNEDKGDSRLLCQMLKITYNNKHVVSKHISMSLNVSKEKNEWYGRTNGFDNDSYVNQVTLLGNLSHEKFKWYEGVLSLFNRIYSIPSHTRSMLKLILLTQVSRNYLCRLVRITLI